MQKSKKFISSIFAVIGLSILVSGCTQYNKTSDIMEVKEVTHSVYSCQKYKNLDVVYFNGKQENYAVITQMGELIPMIEMPTASGIGYRAINENYSYQLHIKGKEATLFERDNKIVLDCKLE